MRLTIEERLEQIKPLAKQGMPPREIANKIGLSFTQTYRIMRKGRADGVIPDTRAHDALKNIYIGTLGRAVKDQTPGFTRWLADEIPKGSTLAEFAVACLADQYHEEMENKNE